MAATITVVCPQCKTKIGASAQHIGRQGRCPRCGTLVQIKATDGESLVSLRPDSPGRSGSWGPGNELDTEVNPWLAAVTGGIAAAFLYAIFIWLDKGLKADFGRFMCQNTWVQPAITFVTCWGLSILVFKLFAVRRQLVTPERELELIPLDIGLQVTAGNVDSFLTHLNGLSRERQGSILLRRVRGALEHFKFRNSVPEVQTYLSTQAQVDASGVDSGYTLLRAFIWVCPILGFVGTVIGISAAIGELKDVLKPPAPRPSATAPATPPPMATDPVSFQQKMERGMEKVTANLATAFETTLLGLICVIFLLFPTEILRKTEYATLDKIEVYANESLLRRMSEGGSALDKDPAGYAREALHAAFQQHQQWLAQWQDQVGRLGQNVGGKFEVAIREVVRTLSEAEAVRLERIDKVAGVLDQLLVQANRTADAVLRASERAAAQSERSTESLSGLQERLGGFAGWLDDLLGRYQRLADLHGNGSTPNTIPPTVLPPLGPDSAEVSLTTYGVPPGAAPPNPATRTRSGWFGNR